MCIRDSNWIINEHKATVAGAAFDAVQTLGYDADKKRFHGSWVDSMMKHKWKYSGKLDDSGKTLLLETEGPDMSNPDKMRAYRDTYEVKSENEIIAQSQLKTDEGKWETFMSSTLSKQAESKQATVTATNAESKQQETSVTPFLMFIGKEGKAEAAIEFYKSVFPDVAIENIMKYGAGETGKEGTVKVATFTIAGQRVMCTDSPPVHDFDFTPSFSFFVECKSEAQLKERFDKLSDGGKVMMPIDNYGFSEKFAWTSDKFGVSWQLNLK